MILHLGCSLPMPGPHPGIFNINWSGLGCRNWYCFKSSLGYAVVTREGASLDNKGSGSKEIKAVPRSHSWVTERKMETGPTRGGCLLQDKLSFVLGASGEMVSVRPTEVMSL